MRVDFTNFGPEPPDKNDTGRVGQSASYGSTKNNTVAGASSGASSEADQASLSYDQPRVQLLAAQVLAQPEIRADRVGTLRQAIGNGHYSVSASDVAEALANDLSAGTHD
jgi:flagellar biosynthesis anti-sigma factor FlgM